MQNHPPLRNPENPTFLSVITWCGQLPAPVTTFFYPCQQLEIMKPQSIKTAPHDCGVLFARQHIWSAFLCAIIKLNNRASFPLVLVIIMSAIKVGSVYLIFHYVGTLEMSLFIKIKQKLHLCNCIHLIIYA